MIHPFAIGATITRCAGSAHHAVLGYVETPLGGRVIACLADDYDRFGIGTAIFHLDPDDYHEVAADPLKEIAWATAGMMQRTIMTVRDRADLIYAALLEARDAS